MSLFSQVAAVAKPLPEFGHRPDTRAQQPQAQGQEAKTRGSLGQLTRLQDVQPYCGAQCHERVRDRPGREICSTEKQLWNGEAVVWTGLFNSWWRTHTEHIQYPPALLSSCCQLLWTISQNLSQSQVAFPLVGMHCSWSLICIAGSTELLSCYLGHS